MAAGENMSEATHVHDDATEHACTIISEASETQPEDYPHTTADETSVSDPDAWLTHLEQYIP